MFAVVVVLVVEETAHLGRAVAEFNRAATGVSLNENTQGTNQSSGMLLKFGSRIVGIRPASPRGTSTCLPSLQI